MSKKNKIDAVVLQTIGGETKIIVHRNGFAITNRYTPRHERIRQAQTLLNKLSRTEGMFTDDRPWFSSNGYCVFYYYTN